MHPIALPISMRAHGTIFEIVMGLLFIGTMIVVILFYMRQFRREERQQDSSGIRPPVLPRVPLQDAQPGLAGRVIGTVRCPSSLLRSPVSGQDCVAYHLYVAAAVRNAAGRASELRTLLDVWRAVPWIWIEDATRRAAVELQQATFSLKGGSGAREEATRVGGDLSTVRGLIAEHGGKLDDGIEVINGSVTWGEQLILDGDTLAVSGGFLESRRADPSAASGYREQRRALGVGPTADGTLLVHPARATDLCEACRASQVSCHLCEATVCAEHATRRICVDCARSDPRADAPVFALLLGSSLCILLSMVPFLVAPTGFFSEGGARAIVLGGLVAAVGLPVLWKLAGVRIALALTRKRRPGG